MYICLLGVIFRVPRRSNTRLVLARLVSLILVRVYIAGVLDTNLLFFISHFQRFRQRRSRMEPQHNLIYGS